MRELNGGSRKIGKGRVHSPSEGYAVLGNVLKLKGALSSTCAKKILIAHDYNPESILPELRFQIESGRFEVKTGVKVERIIYRNRSILYDAAQDPEEVEWRLNQVATEVDTWIESNAKTARAKQLREDK